MEREARLARDHARRAEPGMEREARSCKESQEEGRRDLCPAIGKPRCGRETEAHAATEETAGGALARQEQGVAQSSLMNPDEADPIRPDMRRIYAERSGDRAGAMAGMARREQEHTGGSTEQLGRNEPAQGIPGAGDGSIMQ
eukprot:252286-Hanusia_phi.AAC.1